MIATEIITIRHLHHFSELPLEAWPELREHLNPHWVWVATDEDGKVVATLITAPAHGILILLRIWADPHAPVMAIRKLIKEVAAEVLGLGMVGWMVMLSAAKSEEVKLAKIALRFKGQPSGFVGFIHSGRLVDVCHNR